MPQLKLCSMGYLGEKEAQEHSFRRGLLHQVTSQKSVALLISPSLTQESIVAMEHPNWHPNLWAGQRPGTVLYFKRVNTTHPTMSHQVFHSFYEKIRIPPPFSVLTRNLFLALAETIAQTLKMSSCYVCGGTNMGDQ